MPAVTEPPGLLMYSQMSLASSSPSRYSSWAQMMLAMSSLTSVPRKMIRSFSSRLKISDGGVAQRAVGGGIGGSGGSGSRRWRLAAPSEDPGAAVPSGPRAGVAQLAEALALGARAVWVRVPPPAPRRLASAAMKVHDLPTPSLLVDVHAFDRNVATMAQALARADAAAAREGVQVDGAGRAGWPRPATAASAAPPSGRWWAWPPPGSATTCCWPTRASTSPRLTPIVEAGTARITVAVDSTRRSTAAAAAGMPEVLDRRQRRPPPLRLRPDRRRARSPTWPGRRASTVRGVMGYEGHLMREPGDTKADLVERVDGAAARRPHAAVGGDVVSGGGTGTWDVNTWVTELQAGSYCLMDTEYTPHAAGLRERAVPAGHGDLGQRRGLGRARRRPQGARHGPRRPDGARRRRLLVRVRRAHHLRPRPRARGARSATRCG